MFQSKRKKNALYSFLVTSQSNKNYQVWLWLFKWKKVLGKILFKIFKFPAKKLRKIRALRNTHAPNFFYFLQLISFQKFLIFPPKNLEKIRCPKYACAVFLKKIKGKKNLSVVVSLSSFIVLQSINKITKQYLLSVLASFIIFQQ